MLDAAVVDRSLTQCGKLGVSGRWDRDLSGTLQGRRPSEFVPMMVFDHRHQLSSLRTASFQPAYFLSRSAASILGAKWRSSIQDFANSAGGGQMPAASPAR